MIQINLLPEELKTKTKGRNSDPAIIKNPLVLIKERLFIYAIGAILALFILAHFYFAVLLIFKNQQWVSLNRKWLNSAAQKKEVDEFNREFSASFQDASVLTQLSRQRILWAQKLNALSLHLPAGVWFNEILLNSNSLTIKGSVISLQKEEVGLINRLLDNLKATFEFSKDFSSFELSNVQKRSLGGYDIADFVLVGALKPR
ncbi:MAG: PilN domain-containing protein [Candidatus Omnitrophica bacterium]|nr:PilN domain-containing protein [Candidatus Omnitrophota bacterium]MBU4303227.1 PilN domain-containing protein [Candidatus Omnitrophota bacterium]MBU4419181.1 PilN domain-containing protein [Candidatus Omnitrophota bacterium]MBU4467199.1 PilN domain-containing protein [Candidatus Omnitrophota bacterium]MCG2707309.1 PilN domain-containing protein [Candidatus Omnitrophota bacterium]